MSCPNYGNIAQYYVSKNNISLHDGAFNTPNEAEAFGKMWLETHEIKDFNNENYTITKIKYGIRKGRYRDTYRVYAKYEYLHHCPWGASYKHSGERTVLIHVKE